MQTSVHKLHFSPGGDIACDWTIRSMRWVKQLALRENALDNWGKYASVVNMSGHVSAHIIKEDVYV
jgi:hypothetical protein